MRKLNFQKRIFYVVLSLFLLLIHSTLTHAGPRQVTYKDYLKDPSTSIPYNGTYYVEFRLYNTSTLGTLEFCEVQSITIDNGNIFAHIGKATTGGIPDPVFLPPSSDDYLEVAVGTSISGSGGSDPINLTPCLYSSLTTHSPRIELDAAAYVYHAKKSDSSDSCTNCENANFLDGYNSTDFSSAVHTHNYLLPTTCTNGQITEWNGAAWVCAADDNTLGGLSCISGQIAEWSGTAWVCGTDDVGGGVGTITGVTAGSGLSGGGTSGNVTVSIATGGVTSSHIADGTIGSADIADGSIAAADLGINVTGSVEGVSPNTKGGNIDLAPSPEITITGTDATDTISLSIATGGITSTHIADGAVGSADVADGSLTVADLSVNVVSSVDGVVNDGGNIDLLAGSGIVITPDDINNTITIAYSGTAISGVGVKDEGLSQGTVTSLNFTGTGVTASVVGSEATVNVTGGGTGTDTRCDALGTCATVFGGSNIPGMTTSGNGVTGTTTTILDNNAGLYGFTNSTGVNVHAVLGWNAGTGYGISGVTSSNNSGVAAVVGQNDGSGYGVVGKTSSTNNLIAAVRGDNFGTGYGVYGVTSSTNSDSAGIFGSNLGSGHGFRGFTNSTLTTSAGVHATNNGPGYGLYAYSGQGTGAYIGTGGLSSIGLIVESNGGGTGTAISATGDIKATGHIYAHTSTHVGDIAEPVLAAPGVEPGDVVIINSSDGTFHSLNFSKSASPYDTRVAGIISTNPSMILANDKDRLPLAVNGIVPVKVDASYGAIEPGDLLTSSPTWGYAMKASDYTKAQGAIIGKALERLKDGQSKIMVLVTLQ